ncbi:MAG: MerR family transcriptional regulator [Lacipirellulaceae bacterium]
MFSIGEFSKITGLSVKTLRFYHEAGLLTPSHVDPQTNYRYYNAERVELARVISALREFDFPLSDISEILSSCEDESEILEYLNQQKEVIQERMRSDRRIVQSLTTIVNKETEAITAMQSSAFEIEKKQIQPMLVAGVRMKGKYSDCGQGFAKIGRKYGRHINGKPMLLCYDSEYKAEDADFEPCMPVHKGESKEEIVVRELPGGQALTLLHKGPYDQLGRSYEKIIQHAKDQGLEFSSPTREVYLKGPGMIFKGNPQKYLTEIQLMLKQ